MALPVPDDALAAILRRLPPRSLAAVRCVCKQWRDLVNERALLLPHSAHGVVISYVDHHRPHLFSRPSSSSAAAASDGSSLCLPRAAVRNWQWHVMDHCDGLLLLSGNWGGELCVCNPATRRRATLPPPPQRACRDDVTAIPVGEYLVFDPAASPPHYDVFLIATVPGHPGPPPTPPAHIRLKPMAAAPFCLDERLASLRGASYSTVEEMMEDMAEATVDSPPPSPYEWDQQLYCLMCWQVEYQYLSTEWPPPSYKIDAFSSRTGRWEERVFVREGETATTLEDMKPWNYVYAGPWQGCSVFWQGALYVHSGGACVTR
uniref:F-box domain-containing protein n=1 Tax=Oryza glumipatula TaxID=40148 RepID=A0A0E0BLF7_9ORYZ